jgi:hypothetical protein
MLLGVPVDITISEVLEEAPQPRVLVVGLDPYRLPGPWDPKPISDATEFGLARFAQHGVGVEACLVALDGSEDVEAVISEALRARSWECVVIGGGIRNDDALELFERLLNLVHRCCPYTAIAFNTSPTDSFEAAARWLPTSDPDAQDQGH